MSQSPKVVVTEVVTEVPEPNVPNAIVLPDPEPEFDELAAVAQAEAEEQALLDAQKPSTEERLVTALESMSRIAKSFEKMNARQEEVRQIPLNEVLPVSPWNPEGKKVRVTFARPTQQHGILLDPLRHTEDEIRLFNQLKPGRYFDRKIEVRRYADGGIDLTWAGSKTDDRIAFYSQFRTIGDVLTAIVKERVIKEEKRRSGHVDVDEIL